MSCSASECEHNWSIEGWIHLNRRNRIGQKLVERLVCTHTNLKLEQRLEMYEAGLFPWDIEMTVEELYLTTTTGPPTESLTSSPSLNPSKTLTNFLFNLV
jgi:hypothetical protein